MIVFETPRVRVNRRKLNTILGMACSNGSRQTKGGIVIKESSLLPIETRERTYREDGPYYLSNYSTGGI